ncbi:DMT family transporter [Halothermothrix orenii]|uniref:Uncharacterized protein conserved in bacteria n=1 Tax=Halothermothrix orenii (strain H 168 / OCM 544 / DSM 9562) TaxID=373903 RepID=B8CZW9_HALOH|nr:DMT family transporter [Halothermothrix orenii]ACL70821.1 uncharacterized protein conserved in bacteria [Halothermothrix orenii H 168]
MLGYSWLYLLLAAMAGLTMAVQGSINSVLGKKIGLMETNFIVHATAAIILLIYFIFNFENGNFNSWKGAPWFLYIGGVLGIAITYLVMVSIPELGVAVATTSIVTAQVLTAACIDHFGLFGLEQVPFTWVKFVGVLFLAAGVRLLLN